MVSGEWSIVNDKIPGLIIMINRVAMSTSATGLLTKKKNDAPKSTSFFLLISPELLRRN
jgi:hypothetical protein